MTFVDKSALLSYRRLFSFIFCRKKFLCISAVPFHMDCRNETKSSMEIVSVPPIVSIYRHALQTFDDKYKSDFTTNFLKLKNMMDNLKQEDFGFDKKLSDPATWSNPKKAPCTYIEVFQSNEINMSIFVLKPGFKMPLHDHPHMHGLLKVITGAVKIRTFSEYPLKFAIRDIDFLIRAKHEAARLAQGFHKYRRLFAKVENNSVCRVNSQTCLLTPSVSNYHEIEAMEMPAAFFDILAPPYDTLIEDIGPRRCSFYRVVNEISSNVVELQETDVPLCFYCDQAPYLGPILS